MDFFDLVGTQLDPPADRYWGIECPKCGGSVIKMNWPLDTKPPRLVDWKCANRPAFSDCPMGDLDWDIIVERVRKK